MQSYPGNALSRIVIANLLFLSRLNCRDTVCSAGFWNHVFSGFSMHRSWISSGKKEEYLESTQFLYNKFPVRVVPHF